MPFVRAQLCVLKIMLMQWVFEACSLRVLSMLMHQMCLSYQRGGGVGWGWVV